MSELISFGSAAIGYLAGQGVEQHYLDKIRKNREGIIPLYDKLFSRNSRNIEANNTEDAKHSSFFKRVLGRLISNVVGPQELSDGSKADLALATSRRVFSRTAILSGATLFSVANFLQPNAHLTKPPHVVITAQADLSTATNGVFNESRDAIKALTKGKDSYSIYLAINNQTEAVRNIKELNSTVPFGGSNVDHSITQNLSLGFGNAPTVRTNSLAKHNKSVAGAEVLFIDNTNTISNPNQIANLAQEQGNLPIYIINEFGPGQAFSTNTALENLANETKGHYWNMNEANYSTVISELNSDLKPSQGPVEPNPNHLYWGVSSAALGILATRSYMARKSETAIA